VREWTASGDERERVVRGGSWGDSIDWFLSAGFRGLNHPSERFELTGFRCAAGPLVAVPGAAPPSPSPGPR
jgi:formylglycine-generating enzyme required for sulfatase activity